MKKIIVAALLLSIGLTIAADAPDARLVQSLTGGDSQFGMTIKNTTAGNLLIVSCANVTGGDDLASVGDSAGNTWVRAGFLGPSGEVAHSFDAAGNPITWWTMNPWNTWTYFLLHGPGGTVTVNFNGGSFPGCLSVWLSEWSGFTTYNGFMSIQPVRTGNYHSCLFFPGHTSGVWGEAGKTFVENHVYHQWIESSMTCPQDQYSAAFAFDPTVPEGSAAPAWYNTSGR